MPPSTSTGIQGNLFIKGDIPCKCVTRHAFTEYEFKDALFQANRIKQLILDHGDNLPNNYYHYLGKTDSNCDAWDHKNEDYLILRSRFHKEVEEATIPLDSPAKSYWA